MGYLVTGRWRPDSETRDSARQIIPIIYQAYVPDLIARLDLTFSSSVVQAMSAAEAAISEVEHLVATSGFPTLRQLTSLDALGSGRLSGFDTSARRLAEVLGGHNRRDVAAERVASSVRAAEWLVNESNVTALTPALLEGIHARVLGSETSRISTRSRQTWAGTSRTPRGAEFVPPPPSKVDELVADLCVFVNRDDIPPLAQAAIAHAQFVTICPFWDGNGRTGRLLIHAVLCRRGLAANIILPVSSVLAVSRRRYLDGLSSYREGRLSEYCAAMAMAVYQTAEHARLLAEQYQRLLQEWHKELGHVRSGSAAERLLRVFLDTPVVDARQAENAMALSDEATRLGLIRLDKAGVIRRLGGSSYGRIAVAEEALDILDRWELELEIDQPTALQT